jgi:hypothetical protein
MAVVEATTSIWTHKVKELAGTIFMSIPCGDFDERVQLDHLTIIKAEPEVAACYHDRCATVIDSFYDLHGNMVNEIDTLLAEYMDHDSVMERRSMMDWQVQGSKAQFLMYTYMDGVEVDVDSLESISSPTNPNQTPILRTENKLDANGWEIPRTRNTYRANRLGN